MYLKLFSFILFLTLNNYFCYSFNFSSIFDTEDNKNNEEIKDKNSFFNKYDPDRPLTCYRGLKYLIGQEEMDDNVSCVRNFLEKSAGMDKFCYKFTSNSGGTEFIKRGCSVVMCTPLGVGCTKMEFEGIEGEMCCCSDTSYCNNANKFKINLILIFINILIFKFYFC